MLISCVPLSISNAQLSVNRMHSVLLPSIVVNSLPNQGSRKTWSEKKKRIRGEISQLLCKKHSGGRKHLV